MKKFTLTLALMMAITIVMSQPSAFKYQTVVRDAGGDVLSGQPVSFQISILQGSASGINVYTETHTATTNQFGLVSLEIGNGTVVSGDFSTINWGSDDYFMQIELDENGGGNYQLMGTSQLLSVPYAIYSGRSGDEKWGQSGDDISFTDGKVGIGTQTPETKLEISSVIRLTPSSLDEPCGQNLEGSIYYDDYYKEYCYCDGNSWKQIDGGGFCECVDQDNDGYDICDPGHPYDTDGLAADCDDYEPLSNPGLQEVCDGIDNNCDGLVDNDAIDATIYYPDFDGDGYGDYNNFIFACVAPLGYTNITGDCDDNDPNTYPGAPEICDWEDNDCDQEIDEDAIDAIQFFVDADWDGYGDDNNFIFACVAPPGYVDVAGDCDDTNSDINPGATEICDDLIDNDCDGLIDGDDPDCN